MYVEKLNTIRDLKSCCKGIFKEVRFSFLSFLVSYFDLIQLTLRVKKVTNLTFNFRHRSQSWWAEKYKDKILGLKLSEKFKWKKTFLRIRNLYTNWLLHFIKQ